MKYYEKPLRTVTLTIFTEITFDNRFGKNVLNKHLWWCVIVIFKMELIFISTVS